MAITVAGDGAETPKPAVSRPQQAAPATACDSFNRPLGT